MGEQQFAAGSLFAERFEIEGLAGSGGMGAVYRARDRSSGELVALKLLHPAGTAADDADRFVREAQLLSELSHPGIVAYIAHGQGPFGQRFLAMRWLTGEDLAHRLLRGPLPVQECVRLLCRVADALAAAHERGIIHRDLKPSNLFLPDGSVDHVQILDFGIARRLASTQAPAMTRTGMVMGTPEYMAPEQARGRRELMPTVDVFSLGCVLYECLAGEPPFVADHVAAVLVRILFDEPASIQGRRPGLPAALAALLARMLCKEPAGRPADAAALRAELAALCDVPEAALAQTLAGPAVIRSIFAQSAQELLSVVLAVQPEEPARAGATLGPSQLSLAMPERLELLDALKLLGVSADFLANGALVVTIPSPGSATDQASLAAGAALLIQEHWPATSIALATGRGALQGQVAVGEVVEQAAHLLRRHGQGSVDARAGRIYVDELTARLLRGRCVHGTPSGGAVLLREEEEVDANQRLLGKPTPCVGREAELTNLEGQLRGCIDESEARAVVITAQPGTGKSRLLHEFLRRLRERGDKLTVLRGRASLAHMHTAYAILGQAIRRHCELAASDLEEIQQRQFAARIGVEVAESVRAQVIHFLGELCGVPSADEPSDWMLAARTNARTLRDQLRRAFLEWLGAASQRGPVLIVLDDVQWADNQSVELLGETLRELQSAPLLVVALGRPELEELFPKLWQGSRLQEVKLKGLSKKACERLVLQVLGKQADVDVVARIVEQSSGNALFLEELIRLAQEGSGEGKAETVLAMLQSRLGRLEAGPGRLVRAAAIFGQTFFVGGVAALLGMDKESHELAQLLSKLVEVEIIEPHAESESAEESEYGFCHTLMQEAAFSLLTESDLQSGYQFASQYLQRMEERLLDGPGSLVLSGAVARTPGGGLGERK